MIEYTVTGVYLDSDPIYQRFAFDVEAESVEAAEAKCRAEHDVAIAAVYDDEGTMVDTRTAQEGS